ncbi:MAG: hypothetical protein KKG09_07330 [Verrucomicrobia bacterium]|nr:hypothetical protein [Verrucomicrobiota bacterium]MBU4247414.1 hypothetical protein [Verrucomicrobiota bacterium]MBU4290952.1 hypothetical protein [Verrucomicrobiota bacterium]MBU4497797.1 hypothetical protein [Verrucomicrobiota bacterium]MCG2681674.1 hypothetical protein [Kiritimatiellia bacterium]
MKKAFPFALRIGIPLILTAVCLLALPACRRSPQTSAAKAPAALVENMASGPIECRITVEPAAVYLDRDILLTLRIRAPATMDVRLPPLANRLQGFDISGAFDREPVVQDGFVTREHCVKLTPTLAEEYRLGPLAITYTDRSLQPPEDGWFATRPLTFQAAPVVAGRASSTLADIMGPVRIYPPFKTVALWIGLALLAAAILYGFWFAVRRIHRTIQLRRMSPKERALHELADLMAKDLIGHNQMKEFYLEITTIIRRYIERAHAIRAPEQTTEEFLIAAMQDPRFSRDVVLKLKAFLLTADLVKFAAFRPDPPTVDKTVTTARDYIESDEQEHQQPDAAHV